MKKEKIGWKRYTALFVIIIFLSSTILIGFNKDNSTEVITDPSLCKNVFVTENISNEAEANMIYDSPNCFYKFGNETVLFRS